MNLTEPQAGSDLAAVRARAVPQPTQLPDLGQQDLHHLRRPRLPDNIVHLVLARTPDAPPGTRGISLFVVPKFIVNADGSLGPQNEVRCVSLEHKLGIHASPTAVLAFGDREGAVGYVVGEENRRARVHVRDDESRPLRRRHAGRRNRRARISTRA